MSALRSKIILITFLLLIPAGAAFPQNDQIEITNINIDNDYLTVSFDFNSLFSEKIIQGLDRGLTVYVKYDIELWRKSRGCRTSSHKRYHIKKEPGNCEKISIMTYSCHISIIILYPS